MDETSIEIEARGRELLHFLEEFDECEMVLPFAVDFAIQKLRAAVVLAPPRALPPMRQCQIYRRCAGRR
jgi:hypothetical protein